MHESSRSRSEGTRLCSTWCSSAKRENFNHFALACFNYVRKVSLASLTDTARKKHSNTNARTQVPPGGWRRSSRLNTKPRKTYNEDSLFEQMSVVADNEETEWTPQRKKRRRHTRQNNKKVQDEFVGQRVARKFNDAYVVFDPQILRISYYHYCTLENYECHL